MKFENYIFLLLSLLIVSCQNKNTDKDSKKGDEKVEMSLPSKWVPFNTLDFFKQPTANWKITEAVFVDRTKEKTVSITKGEGILVNIPDDINKGHLYSKLEHGDIELELDVMMPVGSNSGIYFQGRYEIQLFDSWGKDSVDHSDMGGIYQRWDDTKPQGENGYEGQAPSTNACKAPGLWQHFKIIFKAPRFDSSGKKIKNAEFEEVWLNQVLIHKNKEVNGPTRSASEYNEVPKAPLMIQGDHGPVAFRNIRYKLYEDRKVNLADLSMKEYENISVTIPNLDSLAVGREVKTDSISATMALGERPQKILNYVGKLRIPASGDYIFDFKLNRAGGAFLINKDTIISMNGDYILDSLGFSKVQLEKGDVPFQLIYNKHVPWHTGFGLFVEGPGIQKHALHAKNSLTLPSETFDSNYSIDVGSEPITQRSFWMHKGIKRTHSIAVGTPEKVHYAYDLATGSLLHAWNGKFMDARKMWRSRGEKQLGAPIGFALSMHGDPEFAFLGDNNSVWPTTVSDMPYKSFGYEFDERGYPRFSFQIDGVTVSNTFIPSAIERKLKRELSIQGTKEIWYKIADGESIEQLPDGTFLVNDESYFVELNSKNLKPQIRKSNGRDELIVSVPSGKQRLEYTIIW